MSRKTVDPVDGVQLLRTLALHNRHVEGGLLLIRQELERRGHNHDTSKLTPEEFAGFSRINAAAREFPYGSPEYKAGLDAERSVVDLHYSRNSHHPEHHELRKMGWLDIVEMVADWRAAWIAYGSQGTWEENLARQFMRYNEAFNDAQWWLVRQVAAFLVPDTDERSGR